MQMSPGFLREMKSGEEPGVDALLRSAFGGEDEVRLVAALRKSGVIAGESILPGADGPVGYFALSHFVRPKRWLCLAPVAVHPTFQGRGYGKRMIGMLGSWAMASEQTIVVLGEPGFYELASFSRKRAANLVSPFPLSHTLLLRPGHDAPEETLVYPKPFL